ncbi:unnamed protein product [Effrenium voratum]|nr:unnamed protein product [Effrenium voratum]
MAPLIWAHRGASARCPENTLSAFRAALDLGADTRHFGDGVELDVHPTADGKVVVLHDATLERTTDQRGPVSGKTWPELQACDAGAWFSPQFKGEKLPLLEEVLHLTTSCGKKLLIELKGPPSLSRAVLFLANRLGHLPPAYPQLPKLLATLL